MIIVCNTEPNIVECRCIYFCAMYPIIKAIIQTICCQSYVSIRCEAKSGKFIYIEKLLHIVSGNQKSFKLKCFFFYSFSSFSCLYGMGIGHN